MSPENQLIEIANASVYRGDTLVFKDFSLKIPRHTNYAIIGPNGAGKTTLLKLLMQEIYPVYSPTSVVRILGKDRWNVWELRSRLGLVSHDLQNRYAGYASGREVILSGFYSSIGTHAHQQFDAQKQQLAESIMRELEISSLENKLYHTMSTGEQRRFLLARALINEPHTLILDEPTSGLDLKATFHYIDIVRKLMQQGCSILLVTHHIHEIPPEISRVILMRKGKIFADGDKSQVLTGENLSTLYDTPVQLLQANGFYQAVPGKTDH